MFDTIRTTILVAAIALALVAGGVPVSAAETSDQPLDDTAELGSEDSPDVSVSFDDDEESGGGGGGSVSGGSSGYGGTGTPGGGIGAGGCNCKDLNY